MKRDDFNKERLSDGEVAGVSVVNQDRVRDMQSVYKLVKSIVLGKYGTISCRQHEPFASMGTITITAREIAIENPPLFAQEMRLVNLLDVSLKADGKVQLSLVFDGLTRKVANNQ